MESYSYHVSFINFVKKLKLDEIKLLIYIAKLAVVYNTRNVKVSYLDVMSHLNLKGKGNYFVKKNISKLPCLVFEKDGLYFPFLEKAHVRNNHFEFTMTQMFEDDFGQFVKVVASLSPEIIYDINKHHTIYLYLRIKEEFTQRDMMFEYTLFLTTDQLKELFGLGTYGYTDEDGFRRNKFEKIYLSSSVEEINKLDNSISLSWKKMKENRLVAGYLFECSVLKR